jgi:hypothetical protein
MDIPIDPFPLQQNFTHIRPHSLYSQSEHLNPAILQSNGQNCFLRIYLKDDKFLKE